MSAQFGWRSQRDQSAAPAAGILLLPPDQHRFTSSAMWLRDRVAALPLRAALLVCLAVVFAAGYWSSYPRDVGGDLVFNSPRESVGYRLTERFIDGHGYAEPLRHYDALPHDVAVALTPRDAANIDGNVVPKDFAGTMLLYTAVMRVHPSLALFVAPLFAVLGAWALLRITEELFGRTAGLVAFAGWLSFAPLWVNASFIFVSDLPALAFLLLAMWMFVRHWRTPTAITAVLMAAFFCASVLFRYPNVLLAPPVVVALLVGRKVAPLHAFAAALAGLPFVASILVFNAAVYGDPLTTGFHIGAELMRETVNYSRESFFKQRPDVLVQYATTYGAERYIAIPVVLSLAATAWAAWMQRGVVRVMAIVSLALLATLVTYYGQQDAWGYKSPQVSASVLRYLLPGFALTMMFGAWAATEAASRLGRAIYVFPVVLMVAGVWYAHNGPGGVHEVNAVVERSTALKREIVASTEPDAIIAVRIMDKVLLPERQTLTLTYGIQNEEPVSKGGRETWDHVPSPERLAEVMSAISAAGIPAYVLPDAMMGDLTPYQAALLEHGLYYRHVRGVKVSYLYEVVPLGAAAR